MATETMVQDEQVVQDPEPKSLPLPKDATRADYWDEENRFPYTGVSKRGWEASRRKLDAGLRKDPAKVIAAMDLETAKAAWLEVRFHLHWAGWGTPDNGTYHGQRADRIALTKEYQEVYPPILEAIEAHIQDLLVLEEQGRLADGEPEAETPAE